MAIRNDFEDFSLSLLPPDKSLQWRGYTVNSYAVRRNYVSRAARPDENHDVKLVTFSKDGEPAFDLTFLTDLYPRRVYAAGKLCADCTNTSCRECQLIWHVDGEDVVRDYYDIHLDACKECPYRKTALDLFHKLESAERNATCKFIADILQMALGENQEDAEESNIIEEQATPEELNAKKETTTIISESVDEKTYEESIDKHSECAFRLERNQQGDFTLHYEKDGKKRHRTLKCTPKKAEEVLDGVLALSEGRSTDNKQAMRIWGVSVSDETAVYKELFELSQQDNKALQDELQRMEKENSLLRNKCSYFEGIVGFSGSASANAVSDSEIYSGETMYQIRRVLKKYIEGKNVNRTRSLQVINDFLCSDNTTDSRTYYKAAFERAFNADVTAPARERMLQEIGYKQEQLENNHYKVYPTGHPELSVTVSATPSDHRSAQNTISELLHQLFD